jgi:hypothetical protein
MTNKKGGGVNLSENSLKKMNKLRGLFKGGSNNENSTYMVFENKLYVKKYSDEKNKKKLIEDIEAIKNYLTKLYIKSTKNNDLHTDLHKLLYESEFMRNYGILINSQDNINGGYINILKKFVYSVSKLLDDSIERQNLSTKNQETTDIIERLSYIDWVDFNVHVNAESTEKTPEEAAKTNFPKNNSFSYNLSVEQKKKLTNIGKKNGNKKNSKNKYYETTEKNREKLREKTKIILPSISSALPRPIQLVNESRRSAVRSVSPTAVPIVGIKNTKKIGTLTKRSNGKSSNNITSTRKEVKKNNKSLTSVAKEIEITPNNSGKQKTEIPEFDIQGLNQIPEEIKENQETSTAINGLASTSAVPAPVAAQPPVAYNTSRATGVGLELIPPPEKGLTDEEMEQQVRNTMKKMNKKNKINYSLTVRTPVQKKNNQKMKNNNIKMQNNPMKTQKNMSKNTNKKFNITNPLYKNTRKNTIKKTIPYIRDKIKEIKDLELQKDLTKKLSTIENEVNKENIEFKNINILLDKIDKLEDKVGTILADQRRINSIIAKNKNNQKITTNPILSQKKPDFSLTLRTINNKINSIPEKEEEIVYTNTPLFKEVIGRIRTKLMKAAVDENKRKEYMDELDTIENGLKKRMPDQGIIDDLEDLETEVGKLKQPLTEITMTNENMETYAKQMEQKPLTEITMTNENMETYAKEMEPKPLTEITMTNENMETYAKQMEQKPLTETVSSTKEPGLVNKVKKFFTKSEDSKQTETVLKGPNTIESTVEYLKMKNINFLNIFGDIYSISPKTKQMKGMMNNLTNFLTNFEIDKKDLCETLLLFATVFGIKSADFTHQEPPAYKHCRSANNESDKIIIKKLGHYKTILEEKVSLNNHNKKTNKVVLERIRRVDEYIEALKDPEGGTRCTIDNTLSCDEVGVVTSVTAKTISKGCPCPDELAAIKKLLAGLIKKGKIKNINTDKITFESLLADLSLVKDSDKDDDSSSDPGNGSTIGKTELDELQNQIIEMKSMYDRQNELIDRLKEELTTKITRVSKADNKEKKLGELQTQLAELESKTDTSAILGQMNQKLADFKTAQMTDQETKLADLQVQLDEIKSNPSSTVDQKLADFKTAQMTDQETKLADLQVQLDEIKSNPSPTVEIMNEKLEAFKTAQIGEQEQKLAELQSQLQQQIDEIKNLSSSQKDELLGLINSRIDDFRTAQQSNLNQIKSNMKAIIDSQDRKFNFIKNQLMDYVNGLINSDEFMDDIADKIIDSGKLGTLFTKYDEINKGIVDELNKIRDSKLDASKFNEITQQFSTSIRDMNARLEEHKKEITNLINTRLGEYKEKINGYDAKLGEYDQNILEHDEKITQHTQKINELQNYLRNFIDDNYSKIQEKYTDIQNKLNELETKNQELIAKNEELQKIIDEKSSTKQLSDEKIILLQNQIEDLKLKLQTTIDELTTKIKTPVPQIQIPQIPTAENITPEKKLDNYKTDIKNAIQSIYKDIKGSSVREFTIGGQKIAKDNPLYKLAYAVKPYGNLFSGSTSFNDAMTKLRNTTIEDPLYKSKLNIFKNIIEDFFFMFYNYIDMDYLIHNEFTKEQIIYDIFKDNFGEDNITFLLKKIVHEKKYPNSPLIIGPALLNELEEIDYINYLVDYSKKYKQQYENLENSSKNKKEIEQKIADLSKRLYSVQIGQRTGITMEIDNLKKKIEIPKDFPNILRTIITGAQHQTGGSSTSDLFELLAKIRDNPDLDIDAELEIHGIDPTEAVPVLYFMQELIAAAE